jgi:hypothetical protein
MLPTFPDLQDRLPVLPHHDRLRRSQYCVFHHDLGWELPGSRHSHDKVLMNMRPRWYGHRDIVYKYTRHVHSQALVFHGLICRSGRGISDISQLWRRGPRIHQSEELPTMHTQVGLLLFSCGGKHCRGYCPTQLLQWWGVEGGPRIYRLHNSLAYRPSKGRRRLARDRAHTCCSFPTHPIHKYASAGLPPTRTGSMKLNWFLLELLNFGEPWWGSPRLLELVSTVFPEEGAPAPIDKRLHLLQEKPL